MGLFGSQKHFKEKKEIVFIQNTEIINIEGEYYKKHYPGEDERLEKIIAELTGIIDKLISVPPKNNKPIFTLTTFINNQPYIMADVSLVLGTPKTGVFTLLDNKSGAVITGASFSNQAVGTNSNPEFASFALDPSNPSNLIGTGIAAGSGTVAVTTDAAWTDLGDGSSQTGSFSVTKNYTVVASADGASFDVVFP